MAEVRVVRLLIVALVLVAACTQGAETPPPLAADGAAEAQAVEAGWMGKFSRREPDLAALLKSNPGWGNLRDMELFEAVQSFQMGGEATDRLGAARSYLALADLCRALDRLLLEVEGNYLGTRPGPLPAGQRARRLVVSLRAGDSARVQEELAAGPPQDYRYTWGLAARRMGKPRDGTGPEAAPGGDAERAMGAVAAYLWGLPAGPVGQTPYDQGLAAFRAGDLTGGVLTLQLLEFSPATEGPGPELFLYELLERAFAGLARHVLEESDGAAARFLGAEALSHLGDAEAAAALYRSAAGAEAHPELAALLFSPFTGVSELQAVARARAGEAPGPGAGPLASLTGARTPAAVATALGELLDTGELPADGEGAAALPGLYAGRRAAGARLAAWTLWRLGSDQGALEVLDLAHRKASGYRPDFVNPPAFLVDLALGHERVGEYAPAVAVLFELANEYPSARVAYESLKRLYASHTGGEVPPRQ